MAVELVPGVFWGIDCGTAFTGIADAPAASGCRIIRYGGDRVRLAAVVDASVHEGELHALAAVDGFDADPAWEGQLRSYCEAAGVPWGTPGWHLFGTFQ
jgi:hypothetical protein